MNRIGRLLGNETKGREFSGNEDSLMKAGRTPACAGIRSGEPFRNGGASEQSPGG